MEHSHDPFHPSTAFMPPENGPQSMSAYTFRQARWRQAGATDSQLHGLAAEHAERTLDDQLQHNLWLDSHSDPELAAQLDVAEPDLSDPDPADDNETVETDPVPEPDEYTGNVTDILAKVGSSAEKAAAALAAEKTRDKPRVSLVNELGKIIGG